MLKLFIIFFMSISMLISGKEIYTLDENFTPLTNIENIINNNKVYINLSNINKGYIEVKYLGTIDKVKLQISKNEVYTYDLKKDELVKLPFSEGNGKYNIKLFENVINNQYSIAFNKEVEVILTNELQPFLESNQFVDFEDNVELINITNNITKDNVTDLDNINDIFNYVTSNIVYDKEKANNIQTGYLPNLTEILKVKKGICFDYASLMTAMLRIKNIPSKLVIGYANDIYHAWVSIYIKDEGWVDYIYFNGTDWSIIDPTFSSGTDNVDILKNINYIKKYQY